MLVYDSSPHAQLWGTLVLIHNINYFICIIVKVDEEEGEPSQGVKDEEHHEEQLNNVSNRLVDLIRRFPALYQ